MSKKKVRKGPEDGPNGETKRQKDANQKTRVISEVILYGASIGYGLDSNVPGSPL